MRNRDQILNEVLEINGEIETLQDRINKCYEEALKIDDEEDDADGTWSLLANIRSYTQYS
jgi:hypothetical protein